jgi:excinuclease UvrABC ATPase subunit
VPHAERSVYRSYRSKFKDRAEQAWEDEAKKRVVAVLNRPYERLWFKTCSDYTLPMVEFDGHTCSGFNLGAGENALINIFSGILSCKRSLLVVIDEIELGLHEEAQVRLIDELKKLCSQKIYTSNMLQPIRLRS